MARTLLFVYGSMKKGFRNHDRLQDAVYHYDSIASKGLPEDMLQFAKEKTQELNEAYDAVKKDKKYS